MSTTNGRKPLIPYLRQSRAKERTISIEEQRRDVRGWAEREGVALADEIVEQGVSGSKAWRQRGLGEAIAACERGEAAGIVVAWQDRLSRESGLGTAEVWDALDRAGARLVCASEGLDTATGDHEMLFSIKAAIAREQWKRHRANWERAKHSAWERGLYVGEAPAGFVRADGSLAKTEHADAVRNAIRLRAGGGSWTEVARLLSAREVPTSKGRTVWSRASAKAALRNPVYKGLHRCTCGCGETALRPEWRLVSPSVWKAAQPEPGVQAVGRADRGQALLGGLLRCAGCGGTLSPDSTTVGGKTYRHYRCKGRGPACPAAASVPMAAVEEYVVGVALAHLNASKPRVGEEASPEELARLEAASEQARAGMDEVEAERATLSPVAYGRAYDEAQARVAAADEALAEYQGDAGLEYLSATEVADRWARMPVDVRRPVLRELLESAVVARPAVPRARVSVEERVTVSLKELSWPRVAAPVTGQGAEPFPAYVDEEEAA